MWFSWTTEASGWQGNLAHTHTSRTNAAVSPSGRTQWTNWSRKPTWLCWWEPTAGEISSSKPSLWAQVGSPESCVFTLHLLFFFLLSVVFCPHYMWFSRNHVSVCVCWNENRWNPLLRTDERDQMGEMLGTFGSEGMWFFCLHNHRRADSCSPGTAVVQLLGLKMAAGRVPTLFKVLPDSWFRRKDNQSTQT